MHRRLVHSSGNHFKKSQGKNPPDAFLHGSISWEGEDSFTGSWAKNRRKHVGWWQSDRQGRWLNSPKKWGNFFKTKEGSWHKTGLEQGASLVLRTSARQRAGKEQSWTQRWQWTKPPAESNCWLVPDLPQVEGRRKGGEVGQLETESSGHFSMLQQGPQILLESLRQSHPVGQASQELTIQLSWPQT